jgi:hypothetical protein
MASVVCTLVSGLALSWRSNTSSIFLLEQTECNHSDILVFNITVKSPLLFPYTRNSQSNTFLIPASGILLNSFPLKMLCGAIPAIAAWIWVQNGGARFHLPGQPLAGSPHILYHMATRSVVITFLASLCETVTMWHATSTVKAFNNCHYAALTNEQGRR